MSSIDSKNRTKLSAIVAGAAIGAGLLWAWWPLLLGMAEQWEASAEYSHGWLVPLFALAILWMRRPEGHSTRWTHVGLVLLAAGIGLGFLAPAHLTWAGAALGVVGAAVMWIDWSGRDRSRPAWWGGLCLLVGGVAFQLASAHYYLEWFERLALVPILGGCLLLLKGRATMSWSWPAIGFLFFMIPLPYTLEVALRGPLRSLGTSAGTYVLQTLWMPAFAEGNVIVVVRQVFDPEQGIHIPVEERIGVVEACSGLRMLMVFFAISAAFALLAERPLWQKALILLAAVPIALVSNIIRLTVTAVCYAQGWKEVADWVFHDLAGWMMMPLGLGLLWCGLWFLDHLYVTEDDRPMSAGLPARRTAAAPEQAAETERVAEPV